VIVAMVVLFVITVVVVVIVDVHLAKEHVIFIVSNDMDDTTLLCYYLYSLGALMMCC
jgi:hypothetical protein